MCKDKGKETGGLLDGKGGQTGLPIKSNPV